MESFAILYACVDTIACTRKFVGYLMLFVSACAAAPIYEFVCSRECELLGAGKQLKYVGMNRARKNYLKFSFVFRSAEKIMYLSPLLNKFYIFAPLVCVSGSEQERVRSYTYANLVNKNE